MINQKLDNGGNTLIIFSSQHLSRNMFAVPIRGTRVGEWGGSAAGNAWSGDRPSIASILTGENGWDGGAPGSQSTGQEGWRGQVRAPTQPGQVRPMGRCHTEWSWGRREAQGGAGPPSAQPLHSWPSASLSPSSAQSAPAWVQGRRGNDHLRSDCFSPSSRTCWTISSSCQPSSRTTFRGLPQQRGGFSHFYPWWTVKHGSGSGSPEPPSLGLTHLVLLWSLHPLHPCHSYSCKTSCEDPQCSVLFPWSSGPHKQAGFLGFQARARRSQSCFLAILSFFPLYLSHLCHGCYKPA